MHLNANAFAFDPISDKWLCKDGQMAVKVGQWLLGWATDLLPATDTSVTHDDIYSYVPFKLLCQVVPEWVRNFEWVLTFGPSSIFHFFSSSGVSTPTEKCNASKLSQLSLSESICEREQELKMLRLALDGRVGQTELAKEEFIEDFMRLRIREDIRMRQLENTKRDLQKVSVNNFKHLNHNFYQLNSSQWWVSDEKNM